MKISDIINRKAMTEVCAAAAKIPWNDPEFSERMLQSHLNQEHDWASRPNKIIRRHTDWIATNLLRNPAARVLDLGCGPGLYTHLLAQAGYKCTGVDFAPAAIEYAQKRAAEAHLNIEYVLADVRDYRPKALFDLVMMVFGELNEFSRDDALLLLIKAANCLKPGGKLLLEMQTPEAVCGQGQEEPTWQALNDGLLAKGPYLALTENYWDEERRQAATRWFIMEEGGVISSFASCTQSYDKWEFRRLLAEAGFTEGEKIKAKDWPAGEAFKGQLAAYICGK